MRALLLVFLLFPLGAFALDVSSPYVKEGIVEIEFKNRFDEDDRAGEDGFRRHALSASYGVNRRWAVEIGGEYEKTPQEGYGLSAAEIESTFQFTKRGEYWIDSGLKAGYSIAAESDDADEAELRLLLAHNSGRFRHMANIGWAQEIGPNANQNPTGELRLASRYNYIKSLNFGLEYYADWGEFSDMQGWNEQRHRFGPALYGKIADGVSYETGVAFGLSERAEDAVFKFNLEYEFGL